MSALYNSPTDNLTLKASMSERRSPEAIAQLLSESAARARWRITLGDGRVYLVDTYPDSKLLYITNLSGHRIPSCRIATDARAAIDKATGSAA